MAAPPGAAARRACWSYLLAGAAVTAGYRVMPDSDLVPAWLSGTVLYNGLGLSAVAAIVIGARRFRPPDALAWYLFAAGLALSNAADLVFLVVRDLSGADAFPSAADALYLASYPVLMAGMLLLIRRRGPGGDRAGLIDALVVTVALGLLSWTFLMVPHAGDPEVSLPARLVSMAYPLMDLLLLATAVRLAVGGGRRSPALALLGASLVALLATDTLYSIAELSSGYASGSPIDLGWMASYALWGAAALHPSMAELSLPAPRAREVRLGRGRRWLLAAATLVAPAVLAVQAWRGARIPVPALVVGSAALSLLALARAAGLATRVAVQAAERKRLLDRVVQVAEEERMRVAGDLHDGPIQRLLGIGYDLASLRRRFEQGERSGALELLSALEDRVLGEVDALRQVIAELRPPVLDALGLPAALRDLAGDFRQRWGVACTVRAGVDARLDPSRETILFRVAQEALANVAKHARAVAASVSLAVDGGLARLEVRDDGAGFDVARTVRDLGRDHFGLASMRQRVEMAGGTCEVRSHPGRGTTVTATLPLE